MSGDGARRVPLSEVLDRVLTKGVVVHAEAVIRVADIDLVYLNLQVVLTSVETALRAADQVRNRLPVEPTASP